MATKKTPRKLSYKSALNRANKFIEWREKNSSKIIEGHFLKYEHPNDLANQIQKHPDWTLSKLKDSAQFITDVTTQKTLELRMRAKYANLIDQGIIENQPFIKFDRRKYTTHSYVEMLEDKFPELAQNFNNEISEFYAAKKASTGSVELAKKAVSSYYFGS